MFRTSKPSVSFAAGFPETEAVSASRLRGAGILRRSGAVVLKNGSNVFTVDVEPFKMLTVQPDMANPSVHNVVGHRTLPVVKEDAVVLAQFGSHGAALGGLEALSKAYSGLHGNDRAKRSGGMLRTAGVLGALFIGVVLAGVVLSSDDVAPVQAMGPEEMQRQLLAMNSDASKAARFNANEPSLEQLSQGQYEFKPQLKAPEVTAPTLDCAPKN